jgi:predicted DNA-binding mobile mystery protein A
MRDSARQQLDRRLTLIRGMLSPLSTPRKGWVSAVRSGLGMTQADLAHRMGVSRQAVTSLEQREVDGSVTLNALQDVARALDSELVYAIVPRQPIAETLEQRAYRIARAMTRSVHHTMRLEDQETGGDLDARSQEIVRELLASPGRLWTLPDAE